ncbi:transposase family protein [Micromonospora sp. R77]|uniref:transposase family protein n=1 Tax=Micromonospora sp. R77 TaxID=2925836 RepID=UPI0035AEDE46
MTLRGANFPSGYRRRTRRGDDDHSYGAAPQGGSSNVNVQVIADAAGRLVWASPALPGSVHDLTAARTHGIIEALSRADVMTFADKGCQGARGSVRTPFKRHRFRPKLSRRQKTVNRAHARIRARGERAIATLKTWKILNKLRCCPRRVTPMVQAILVLHHVETNRYPG